MPTLQDLLREQALPGHCFRPEYYINPDIHSGLLESRGGYRLAAFPSTMLQALYSGLRYETGQATALILFNCGRQWGEEFYRRFEAEISEYHHQPLIDLPVGVLLDSLSDLWATHGWGRLTLDFGQSDQGLVEATIYNSGFAAAAKASLGEEASKEPSCYLEAGVLACLFSQISGRDLTAVQTTCESMGAVNNRFLIGTPARLKPVQDWVKKGGSHEEILNMLLQMT